MKKYRTEHDLLGSLKLPGDAYWGIHTERGRRNFPISGYEVSQPLIKAMAMIKKACCLANYETGYLDEDKAKAIISSCEELMEGRFLDQIRIDALQGGAGTSTNMSINEVIANRAIEILGGSHGDYRLIHPLDMVNLHQSTNDTYPTAIKVASIYELRRLGKAIARLQKAFLKKGREYAKILKIGRTEMQEAVPISLGAEFLGFAEAVSHDRLRIPRCEECLHVVNIGGTAVGTHLTAPHDYFSLILKKLQDVTSLELIRERSVIGETANADCFVEVSGMLHTHATNLIKICDDLRLLNLLGEIKLPPLQAGSSIMPGKVNPVIAEATIQVGIKVMANNYAISEVASRGTLQINEFLPLLAHSILESLKLLTNIDLLLAKHISDISANEERCREYLDRSPSIITAFLPLIGYEKATKLAMEFSRSGEQDVKAFIEKKLGKEPVRDTLSTYILEATDKNLL